MPRLLISVNSVTCHFDGTSLITAVSLIQILDFLRREIKNVEFEQNLNVMFILDAKDRCLPLQKAT